MIQLALDVIDKKTAFKIAEMCLSYVDILEAGTPLIKRQGIRIVKELKRYGLPVAADLKTFDGGYLEAELAALNGADYATVLAVSGDRTLVNFVEGCRNYGMKSVAEFMHCPLERALFLQAVGIDYICVHSASDEQIEGKTPFGVLRKIREMVKVPLIVAGGINEGNVAEASEYADIVVIGSAITRARNPGEVARSIRRAYTAKM